MNLSKWRHYWQPFRPSPTTIIIFLLSVGALGIGLLLTIAFALGGDMDDPWGTGAFVYGIVSSPVAMLLLLVGALVEKRKPARALILFLMGLCASVAGLIVAAGMSLDPDMGLSKSLGMYAMCCAPISILAFVPSILTMRKGWPQLKQTVAQSREQALIDLIKQQGQVTLAQAAYASAIPLAEIENHIHSQSLLRKMDAVVYRPEGLVFDRATLERSRTRLLATLKVQGRALISDLAQEFAVSERIIREWVIWLVDADLFSGYIRWRKGILYSSDAAEVGEGRRCPQCGGTLELIGQGMVHCLSCGTELFLKGGSRQARPAADIDLDEEGV